MLGYRSTFDVALDPAVGLTRDNAVATLLGEGFEWMRVQKKIAGTDSLQPLQQHVYPDGSEAVYVLGRADNGTAYGRLTYLDAPHEDGRWATTLIVGLDTTVPKALPRVSIEVEAPTDPHDSNKPHWTAVPNLANQILSHYRCTEHGLRLTSAPGYIDDPASIPDLRAVLEDAQRRNLVILSGEDGTVPVKEWQRVMGDITRQTAGQATVLVLGSEAMTEFNDSVSEGHQLSAYSPRTFLPPADLADRTDGRRHKILSAKHLLGARPTFLRGMYSRVSREHANAQPVETYFRRIEIITAQALDAAMSKSETVEIPTLDLEDRPIPPPSNAVFAAEGHQVPREEATTPPDHGAPAVPQEADTAPEQQEEVGGDTPRLRAALRELVAENAQLHAEQADRDAVELSLREALEKANSAIHHLETTRDDKVLEAMETEEALRTAHKEELDAVVFDNLQLDEDLRGARNRVRTLEFQLEQAQRILAENSIDASGSRIEPEARYSQDFGTWEEIEEFGASKFPDLVFTCDWKKMMVIADRDESGVWFQSTWDSLAMLNDYARFKTSAQGRTFAGGLREYLRGGAPAGSYLISADRYRATESEQVQANKKYATERRFDVPKDVDPSGTATMLSHIVIQTKGSMSPRLYFLDVTDTIGKIIIGYIGRHPKNTMTN